MQAHLTVRRPTAHTKLKGLTDSLKGVRQASIQTGCYGLSESSLEQQLDCELDAAVVS